MGYFDCSDKSKGLDSDPMINSGKCLVWDLDGTLLNSIDDLAAAANYALRCVGLPERNLEQIRSFVGNGIARLLYLAAGQGAGQDEHLAVEMRQHFDDYYSAHLWDRTYIYDGLENVVRTLAEQKQMAVLSNKAEPLVERLSRHFFADCFSLNWGQREERSLKPSPEALYQMMQILAVDPQELIYIGDSEVDLQFARNAGVRFIGVSWGFRGRESLLKLRADYVVDTPQALLDLLLYR